MGAMSSSPGGSCAPQTGLRAPQEEAAHPGGPRALLPPQAGGPSSPGGGRTLRWATSSFSSMRKPKEHLAGVAKGLFDLGSTYARSFSV